MEKRATVKVCQFAKSGECPNWAVKTVLSRRGVEIDVGRCIDLTAQAECGNGVNQQLSARVINFKSTRRGGGINYGDSTVAGVPYSSRQTDTVGN